MQNIGDMNSECHNAQLLQFVWIVTCQREYSQSDVSWLMFSKSMLSVCRSCTHTYLPDF